MPILLGAFSHFYSVTYRRMLSVLLYYVTLLASSCSLQILHSNLFIMSGKFVFFYFSHHSLALPAPLCTFHVQIHISLFLFIRSAIFILLPIVLNTYSTTIILMHSSFNIPSCLRLLLFYQNSVFCTNVFFRFFSFFFCLFKFFPWNKHCSELARLKRAFLYFNMRISSFAHTNTRYMHTQLNLTHFFATCKRMSNSVCGVSGYESAFVIRFAGELSKNAGTK